MCRHVRRRARRSRAEDSTRGAALDELRREPRELVAAPPEAPGRRRRRRQVPELGGEVAGLRGVVGGPPRARGGLGEEQVVRVQVRALGLRGHGQRPRRLEDGQHERARREAADAAEEHEGHEPEQRGPALGPGHEQAQGQGHGRRDRREVDEDGQADLPERVAALAPELVLLRRAAHHAQELAQRQHAVVVVVGPPDDLRGDVRRRRRVDAERLREARRELVPAEERVAVVVEGVEPDDELAPHVVHLPHDEVRPPARLEGAHGVPGARRAPLHEPRHAHAPGRLAASLPRRRRALPRVLARDGAHHGTKSAAHSRPSSSEMQPVRAGNLGR